MLLAQQRSQLRSISSAWPEERPEIVPATSCWFKKNNRTAFRKLCSQVPDGLFLELGTWTGMGSTRFVLEKFPNMDMICIDHFKGSEEHQQDEHHRRVASQLWLHFCANLWEYRDRVFPFRVSTLAGMQIVAFAGIQPDFVYIDAAHDEDSVYYDIRGALNLFPDAILIGDDFGAPQTHPGVQAAVDRALADGLFAKDELEHIGRAWYLTRNVK